MFEHRGKDSMIIDTRARAKRLLVVVGMTVAASLATASVSAAAQIPVYPGAGKSVSRDSVAAAATLNQMGDDAPPINAAGASLMAAQYAASHDVSDEQAGRVIDRQLRGSGVLQVLKQRLGADLVGVRYDADRARWEVALSPTADRAVVDKLLAARGIATVTDVERPSWTAAEKAQTLDQLREKYAAMIKDDLVSIDDAGTELQIRTSSRLSAADRAELRASTSQLRVEAHVVPGAVPKDEATPVGECNNIWCNSPVRAGERWVNGPTQGICTTAFPVTSPVDTYHGFVLTAGHCVINQLGSDALKCSLTRCDWRLGIMYTGYYGGGDGGLIRIEEPQHWATWGAWWLPYAGAGGADSLPTRPQYLPAVGEYVCHVGTGYFGAAAAETASCGTVTNNNKQVNNAAAPASGLPAVTLYAMIEVQGGCIQKGNSGGPTLNPGTGQAIGIISSGSAPEDGSIACSSSVTWNSEYVGNTLLNFGVSLMTS